MQDIWTLIYKTYHSLYNLYFGLSGFVVTMAVCCLLISWSNFAVVSVITVVVGIAEIVGIVGAANSYSGVVVGIDAGNSLLLCLILWLFILMDFNGLLVFGL